MLVAHNAVRARVHTPALQWSDKLSAFAQEWADSLIKRHEFAHRPNNPYGENIFEVEGGAATPEMVVSNWAEEEHNYDYPSNRCNGVCGHYTQIIWKTTEQVGCAMARGGNREIWVCNYNPPGNIAGRKPY